MNSLQKKIWVLAIVVLLIMTVIWVSLTYYNQKMQDQYNYVLERYLTLNELTSTSQNMITELNNYLVTPTSDHLELINTSKKKIEILKYDVMGHRNEANELALANYMNLIDSLVEATDRSVRLHEEPSSESSMIILKEATHISNYISEMTLTLIDLELKTFDPFYRGIITQSEGVKKLGFLVLSLIIILLLLFTYWFSIRITKPVKKLTEAASYLSKGRFDVKIEVDSRDEIAFLAQMFEQMRVNINNLISEIRQKAKLEQELQQSKLLLKESQLQRLQSQINPHFLFNTLNTLSKKAYMEGSEETSDLITSVADLLRYNLKHLDKNMTLIDEVNVLRDYMEIQKARFTDRLNFYVEMEETCLQVEIPGLTIQPIVENAVMYAVEPFEQGGVIWFRVKDGGDRVIIEVEDDGPGMSDETITQIMEERRDSQKGQTSGIGLSNVVKRLRLFNGCETVMEIESKVEGGTKVTIYLFKERR
ncbi:sensor histidine kinase [Alkalihalobacillus sp. MEB130]|uniref:sensor histidine kinase n=1 Tax=Alkalihalobacillus sp. MEB130 TaxID=2976704 RepID=UPI0028DFFEFF|nr:sensor histidine kinase [Alkalihalobacillus sp. MEB130]MDT8860708.1 sensor histidine kinase [Alkalihalobacillus sp. MEB130]